MRASAAGQPAAGAKHVNFFEEEEKALFQHEQEFKKRKMYQEKNNEFAIGGKGGKSRSMSEFDIVANELSG